MKRSLLLVLALVCCVSLLAACAGQPNEAEQNNANMQSDSGTASPPVDDNTAVAPVEPKPSASPIPEGKAAIVSRFSRDKEETVLIDNDGKTTPEILLQGLSDKTGLVFKADSIKQDGTKMTVDFNAETTFIKSDGGAKGNEGYDFSDYASLTWFMLDSVMVTMRDNLGVTEISYMQGGKPLSLTKIPGLELAGDGVTAPYIGSDVLKMLMAGGGDAAE